MFAGYKTAYSCSFSIDIIEEFICFSLEISNRDLIITNDVNMKVTIAGMTEGFNSKTEFLAYTVYILNIWSDLVQRNNNVTFIKHFETIFPVCLSFDSFQE